MKKVTFLFWNTGQKNVVDQLANLVKIHSIDILILAENNIENHKLLAVQNLEVFAPIIDQNNKVQIFSKLPYEQFFLAKNELRYTVRLLNFDGIDELLLVALHFPSKINLTDDQQNSEATVLNMNIAQIEKDYGIDKTVVVGDFNMHPFDYGMVSHTGFNSVMTKKIAKKGFRQVQSKKYAYFYNPMWSFLGDVHNQVSGTLFRSGDFNWHLFDQLLIRPKLIQNFDHRDLKIITNDGESNFLNKNGRIRRSVFSDHLPLKFSLNF